MEEMMEEMTTMCNDALLNIEQVKKGNKAAARRLRKFTLEMGNGLGKVYRKESVKKESV